MSRIVAEVVLLQADRHKQQVDLFCKHFLYGSNPLAPGVYPWPESLPEQTFTWPKRPVPVGAKADSENSNDILVTSWKGKIPRIIIRCRFEHKKGVLIRHRRK